MADGRGHPEAMRPSAEKPGEARWCLPKVSGSIHLDRNNGGFQEKVIRVGEIE